MAPDTYSDPRSQSQSLLLKLPFEVRTEILKYLVVSSEPIPFLRESITQTSKLNTTVLRVCQQLYEEGIGLFWKYNTPRVSCTVKEDDLPYAMDWTDGREQPLFHRQRPIQRHLFNVFLYDIMPKFSKLHVFYEGRAKNVGSGFHWDLHDTVSNLNKCEIQDKCVTMEFGPIFSREFKVYDPALTGYIIGAISIIRCKKLSLPNIQDRRIGITIDSISMYTSILGIQNQYVELLSCVSDRQCNASYPFGCDDQDREGKQKAIVIEELDFALQEAVVTHDISEYTRITARVGKHCERLMNELDSGHGELIAHCEALIRNVKVFFEQFQATLSRCRPKVDKSR